MKSLRAWFFSSWLILASALSAIVCGGTAMPAAAQNLLGVFSEPIATSGVSAGASIVSTNKEGYFGSNLNNRVISGSPQVNDLLLIFTTSMTVGSPPTVNGSGRSLAALTTGNVFKTGYVANVYAIALNSADVATGTYSVPTGTMSSNFSDYAYVLVRGATSAVHKQFAASTGNAGLSFTGYAPSGGSIGTLVIAANTSASPYTNAGSGGGAWTSILAAADLFATFEYSAIWNTGYTNAGVTISGFSSSLSGDKGGELVELLP